MPRAKHNLAERLCRVSGPLIVLYCCATASAADKSVEVYPGDIGQAVATVIIFLILLAVLGRWAWKPLLTQLRMREQNISDTIARSEQREQEAQDLLAHYKARLEHAQTEATALVNKARAESGQMREELLESAKQESQKSIQQAREEIELAKQAAIRDLYGATAELSVDIAESLMRKSLSQQDQQRLLVESLHEVKRHLEREQ